MGGGGAIVVHHRNGGKMLKVFEVVRVSGGMRIKWVGGGTGTKKAFSRGGSARSQAIISCKSLAGNVLKGWVALVFVLTMECRLVHVGSTSSSRRKRGYTPFGGPGRTFWEASQQYHRPKPQGTAQTTTPQPGPRHAK